MKRVAKSELPEKTCIVCGRPFSWRKKWEQDWASVKFCSDKCRMNKRGNTTNRLESTPKQ